MSRGRVLDESGMSFDEMRKSRGTSREDAMTVLFFLRDVWTMKRSEKADPWWILMKDRMFRYNYQQPQDLHINNDADK